jgi:hypothetical protein
LFTANASSTVRTRTTESTGPKISSCSSRDPAATPVKMVGWKKCPWSSAPPVARAPPSRSSAPSACPMAT